MINQLRNHTVYYYYDEPLIIGSEDSFGVRYISVLVGDEEEPAGYLVLKPTRNSFSDFLIGKKALLDLYLDHETSFGFIKEKFSLDKPFVFTSISRNEVIDSWYPGPRFRLQQTTSESIAIDSKLNNLVLFNLGLEANESVDQLRVSVDNLVEVLSQFSKLRQKAWGALKRSGKLSADTYLPVTDVTGFAYGSFKVNLIAREHPDLTGKTITEDILELITEILTDIEMKELSLIRNKIQYYKSPEIISSLVSLSNFITKKGCPIYLEWATPRKGYMKKRLSRESAMFVLNNLGHDEKLKSYYEDITGVFVSASTKSGNWSVSVSKGLTIKGKTSKQLGKSALEGIVLTDKLYKLKCKFEVFFDLKKNEEVQKVELMELTPVEET